MPSSLFTRIFALVLATVAIAQLINLALLALLAPDPPQSVPISQVAQAILSGSDPVLLMRSVPSPPRADKEDLPAATNLETILAARLELPKDDVAIDLAPIQNGKLVQVFIGSASGKAQVAEPALLGDFQVAVRDETQGWMLIEPRNQKPFDNRERRFLLLFLASALIMMPIAWIFARRLAEPFEQFADAAERLGRDPGTTPPDITGPAEVERAAQAFRQMQQRLQAYVSDRTQMLGAIAHDLRTPLTRLAFRLEALDQPGRDAMARDVAEMEAMVSATMGLARSEGIGPERHKMELGSLLERVADDMALTGRKVSAEVVHALVVDGDPVALGRLFANLLDNAETYGGRAHARMWRNGDMAVVDVDDDGPGLPPHELDRVFEPFYRIERSRSRETGGIGLGLSVVRSVARVHGGDVTLENRPEGGLRARLTIPLAPSEKSSRC